MLTLVSPTPPAATYFAQEESRRIWKNGGAIENAQAIAAHESPRTTKLYAHRNVM